MYTAHFSMVVSDNGNQSDSFIMTYTRNAYYVGQLSIIAVGFCLRERG